MQLFFVVVRNPISPRLVPRTVPQIYGRYLDGRGHDNPRGQAIDSSVSFP